MLSKKFNVNKVLLLTLMLTFVSIPMLSTFIYGDLPSLAFSLFCVYYMMKYVENIRNGQLSGENKDKIKNSVSMFNKRDDTKQKLILLEEELNKE